MRKGNYMMKNTLLICFLVFIYPFIVNAQAVYVDSSVGEDKNPGTKEAPVFSIQKAAEIIESRRNDVYTIKINPGIYVLDSHVKIATEKKMINKGNYIWVQCEC